MTARRSIIRLVVPGLVAGLGLSAVALAPGKAAAAPTSPTGRAGSARSAPGGSPAAGKGTLRLLSASPSGTAVTGTTPLVLRFSEPLAASTPLPRLSPPVPGAWARDANELVYRPAGAFAPANTFSVELPAGPAGPRAGSGATLARAVDLRFSTRGGSAAGAEAALAALDYLPATLAAPTGARLDAAQSTATVPATLARAFYGATAPRLTADAWAPPALRSLLAGADGNLLLQGAVTSFQRVHGLAMTGTLDAPTWKALATAAADPAANQQPGGYTYALADQQRPETLTVWDNGRVVVDSPANTGIPASPTANGSFLVYERLASQVMRGTNPWGTPYADPVSWVAYFNGGDAVHYIARAAYGYPQSLGCVELPYTAAATAWPYLRLGTVVTVEG